MLINYLKIRHLKENLKRKLTIHLGIFQSKSKKGINYNDKD